MSGPSLFGERKSRILVVEDEHHLAVGIRYNLEAEGYQVEVVNDGRVAFRLLQEQRGAFDLVILDIMLPGMSGYSVCASLREMKDDTPVLILSARTLTEDRVRGYDAGADHYLQKPFELEELLGIVRNLLLRRRAALPGETRSAPLEEFSFGDVVVDFNRYEAAVRGQTKRLTAMQLRLLRYFIEHEGKVITRGELLENVWGIGHEAVTRTVDNFVLDLRKMLELDPANPRHFLSVRGAGYRFVAGK